MSTGISHGLLVAYRGERIDADPQAGPVFESVQDEHGDRHSADADAVSATLRNRGTEITADPVGLGESFAADSAHVRQWKTFRRRSRLDAAPEDLSKIFLAVGEFAKPVLSGSATRTGFRAWWAAGGPWTEE